MGAKHRHEVVYMSVQEDSHVVEEVLLGLFGVEVEVAEHYEVEVLIEGAHSPGAVAANVVLDEVDYVFHVRDHVVLHLNQVVSFESKHHQSQVGVLHQHAVRLKRLSEELIQQEFVLVVYVRAHLVELSFLVHEVLHQDEHNQRNYLVFGIIAVIRLIKEEVLVVLVVLELEKITGYPIRLKLLQGFYYCWFVATHFTHHC